MVEKKEVMSAVGVLFLEQILNCGSILGREIIDFCNAHYNMVQGPVGEYLAPILQVGLPIVGAGVILRQWTGSRQTENERSILLYKPIDP